MGCKKMTNVFVVEKLSGKCVAVVPIVFGMMDKTVSREDFIKEAWKCAVEDGLVNAENPEEYTFQVKE